MGDESRGLYTTPGRSCRVRMIEGAEQRDDDLQLLVGMVNKGCTVAVFTLATTQCIHEERDDTTAAMNAVVYVAVSLASTVSLLARPRIRCQSH